MNTNNDTTVSSCDEGFLPDSAFRNASYFDPSLQFPAQENANIWFPLQEARLVNDRVDMRTLVSPLDQNSYSGSQGQLLSRFEDEDRCGTGIICVLSRQPLRVFLLTCAHNFEYKVEGIQPRMNRVKSCTYQYAKDGHSKYHQKAWVSKYSLYPGYQTSPILTSGNDLAIGLLNGGDFSRAGISRDSTLSQIEQVEAKIGDTIMVVGYPVEKEGFLYKMEGTISGILNIGGDRKIILYKDIDTTGGQSGGPVYLKRGNIWHLIGIHVGFDPSVRSNVATAITGSILSWILDAAKEILRQT